MKRRRPVVRAKKESKRSSLPKFLALAFVVIGVLVMGYWMMAPDSDNIDAAVEPSSSDIVGVDTTVAQTPQDDPTDSPAAVTASSGETPKTVTNSIGMEFVLIPAGEFKMGSPLWEEGRYSDEGPVHTVTIEKAYYLGKYEVSQKQWHEVMGNNPSYFEGENRPVEEVSWNDIQEFIKKLNEIEGTNKYRLPSEAEWEYAARAGTTTPYSFGNYSYASTYARDVHLHVYAWYGSNIYRGGETHQVGQKQPNSWGLYDMHGNVWEIVQDRYYFNYDNTPTDGSAEESGSSLKRVSRGGSWSNPAKLCRSANRCGSDPDYRTSLSGFRLLLEV